MQVFSRRPGDGEGLQPRHPTCDLRRRDRGKTRALRREIANAIAVAAVDNISLACVHAEPVSQWKGFWPGMTGMRAIYAAGWPGAASHCGPKRPVRKPDGLERTFGQSIRGNWEDPSLEIVNQTVLKTSGFS